MIIVYFTQQLGNQMFQYALGKRLEMLGKDVKFYSGYYDEFPKHDFALPRLFNLKLNEATKEEAQALMDVRRRIVNRVKRRVFGIDDWFIHELQYPLGPKPYNPKVLKFRHGTLNGYWQSEKYFLPIADTIRRDFVFPEPSQRNKELADEMSKCTSVSIHVRRGDYKGLFPLLADEYYSPAMSHFTDRFDNVHFYVFSNDIPWCREHLAAENITFVDWNTGKDSPYDMWLMTQCKHNIIANSSFSWWGAWLNRNEGKEVVAPWKWDDQPIRNTDIYCPEWILL